MTERESGKKIAFSKDERDQVLKNFLIQVKNQHQEQQKPVEVQENLRRNKLPQERTCTESHLKVSGPANPPSGTQSRDPALLQKHLVQYEKLMQVQPQRHTQRQREDEERRRQKLEQETRYLAEMEEARRDKKRQFEARYRREKGTSQDGRDGDVKKSGVENEADTIQRRTRTSRRRPKGEPYCNWESSLAVKGGGGSTTANVWENRQQLLKSLTPANIEEEETMLKQALEISAKETSMDPGGSLSWLHDPLPGETDEHVETDDWENDTWVAAESGVSLPTDGCEVRSTQHAAQQTFAASQISDGHTISTSATAYRVPDEHQLLDLIPTRDTCVNVHDGWKSQGARPKQQAIRSRSWMSVSPSPDQGMTLEDKVKQNYQRAFQPEPVPETIMFTTQENHDVVGPENLNQHQDSGLSVSAGSSTEGRIPSTEHVMNDTEDKMDKATCDRQDNPLIDSSVCSASSNTTNVMSQHYHGNLSTECTDDDRGSPEQLEDSLATQHCGGGSIEVNSSSDFMPPQESSFEIIDHSLELPDYLNLPDMRSSDGASSVDGLSFGFGLDEICAKLLPDRSGSRSTVPILDSQTEHVTAVSSDLLDVDTGGYDETESVLSPSAGLLLSLLPAELNGSAESAGVCEAVDYAAETVTKPMVAETLTTLGADMMTGHSSGGPAQSVESSDMTWPSTQDMEDEVFILNDSKEKTLLQAQNDNNSELDVDDQKARAEITPSVGEGAEGGDSQDTSDLSERTQSLVVNDSLQESSSLQRDTPAAVNPSYSCSPIPPQKSHFITPGLSEPYPHSLNQPQSQPLLTTGPPPGLTAPYLCGGMPVYPPAYLSIPPVYHPPGQALAALPLIPFPMPMMNYPQGFLPPGMVYGGPMVPMGAAGPVQLQLTPQEGPTSSAFSHPLGQGLPHQSDPHSGMLPSSLSDSGTKKRNLTNSVSVRKCSSEHRVSGMCQESNSVGQAELETRDLQEQSTAEEYPALSSTGNSRNSSDIPSRELPVSLPEMSDSSKSQSTEKSEETDAVGEKTSTATGVISDHSRVESGSGDMANQDSIKTTPATTVTVPPDCNNNQTSGEPVEHRLKQDITSAVVDCSHNQASSDTDRSTSPDDGAPKKCVRFDVNPEIRTIPSRDCDNPALPDTQDKHGDSSRSSGFVPSRYGPKGHLRRGGGCREGPGMQVSHKVASVSVPELSGSAFPIEATEDWEAEIQEEGSLVDGGKKTVPGTDTNATDQVLSVRESGLVKPKEENFSVLGNPPKPVLGIQGMGPRGRRYCRFGNRCSAPRCRFMHPPSKGLPLGQSGFRNQSRGSRRNADFRLDM